MHFSKIEVRGETVRQGVRCFSAVEIQTRYAAALFETAKKQNALDKVASLRGCVLSVSGSS